MSVCECMCACMHLITSKHCYVCTRRYLCACASVHLYLLNVHRLCLSSMFSNLLTHPYSLPLPRSQSDLEIPQKLHITGPSKASWKLSVKTYFASITTEGRHNILSYD